MQKGHLKGAGVGMRWMHPLREAQVTFGVVFARHGHRLAGAWFTSSDLIQCCDHWFRKGPISRLLPGRALGSPLESRSWRARHWAIKRECSAGAGRRMICGHEYGKLI